MTLNSCATLNLLQSDVRAMNHDTRIVGRVDGSRGERVKVLVVKKNAGREGLAIADATSPNGMGDFVFLLPHDPSYFLAAVRARDCGRQGHFNKISVYVNGTFQEIPTAGDPDPKPWVLDFARNLDRKNPLARDLGQAFRNWSPDQRKPSGAVPIACGEIASLDDPIFDPTAGVKGLWAPVTSIKRTGLGIYFLEPYDPAKIPVIFVHGIGGTPRSWATMIRSLDRRRYQAWIYNYPSGLPIESVAKGLAGLSDRLHHHYGFEKLHVVAHSMGGLVACRAVQMISTEQGKTYVASLTTISTPWNGVSFAAIGAVGLPVPVPCWLDLRPGSNFIRKVLTDPLPVPHLLISTEKSSFHLTLPRRNDGSVSVASQQDARAVSRAAATRVIPQDHTGVLEAAETRQSLKTFLGEIR